MEFGVSPNLSNAFVAMRDKALNATNPFHMPWSDTPAWLAFVFVGEQTSLRQTIEPFIPDISYRELKNDARRR